MKLYVKGWCPWCREAEDWLNARGHSFLRIDVAEDPIAMAHMREISGQTLTPTLEMPDGRVLPDFDTGQLEAFLAEGEGR